MTENNNNGQYNLFEYIDVFVEEGYPLLQESLAAVDAEEPGEVSKAELAEGIGEDLWGFFGCAGCIILLGALLDQAKDQAVYDEIREVNLKAAAELYPDMEEAVKDFYEFLYENEEKTAGQDEELLLEYLTLWLATNFFDKEPNEEFLEDELDVAYVAAGTYSDFLKQILLIQKDTFGPYIKDSINEVYISGLFNLDDGNDALN